MLKCRLCGAAEGQTVRAEHVYGADRTCKFYTCKYCKTIYLYPHLTDEEEKHFYKIEFSKFMASRSGTERDWTNAQKHIETNQDHVKRRLLYLKPFIKAGVKVLEIGCSSGFMLDALSELGADCVGIEPSGEFLHFLKGKGYRAYESLDVFMSENPHEKFDLVLHFFVLEHIGNPIEFLTLNIACLQKGGAVIAEIPSATDALTSLYKIEAFERFYWTVAHQYYFTPQSLAYLLDKIGDIQYTIIPEQRYDLSNHITWLMHGVPGGQGKITMLSAKTLESYADDLKKNWLCDTMILNITKT